LNSYATVTCDADEMSSR